MFKRMMRPMLSFASTIPDIDGAEFAGRAVIVGAEPESEPEQLPARSLYQRLLNLPLSGPEQKERRDELLGPLFAAEQEAEEFIEAVLAERSEALENQLEEVRKKGRAQQKIIDRLSERQRQLKCVFDSCQSAAEWCRNELNNLHTTRMSRWASKEERQQLQRAIARAEADVKQANAELVEATNNHNSAANTLAEAFEVMGRISNDEIRLRGQLSGKTYADPETALPVVPR